MRLFIDTGALIAKVDKNDQYHSLAIQIFKHLENNRLPYQKLYISDHVLIELITYIERTLKSRKVANQVHESILNSKAIEIIYVDATIQKRAQELYTKYIDQKISIIDCTSFAICEVLKIQTIFTFDSDFKILGLNTLPD